LTIEDDAAIRRGIVDALTFAGYEVHQAATGREGQMRSQGGGYDLILLDLVLPQCGGMEILQKVRERHPTLPVIVLTARGDEGDRVQGLRTGADDYVVKPFSIQELLARIEAVLRRSPQRPQELTQVSFAGGIVDFSRREICLADRSPEQLSEREAELLLYLAKHHQRVISREEILANVWHLAPRGVHTRTIDMHIARLREKLGDIAEEPKVLQTVRGKGYMFRRLESEPLAGSH
jgi:DNA-binding response OmpR family regulator